MYIYIPYGYKSPFKKTKNRGHPNEISSHNKSIDLENNLLQAKALIKNQCGDVLISKVYFDTQEPRRSWLYQPRIFSSGRAALVTRRFHMNRYGALNWLLPISAASSIAIFMRLGSPMDYLSFFFSFFYFEVGYFIAKAPLSLTATPSYKFFGSPVCVKCVFHHAAGQPCLSRKYFQRQPQLQSLFSMRNVAYRSRLAFAGLHATRINQP